MSTRSDQRKDAAEHGLYDPAYEHDACGVGFVASVKGQGGEHAADCDGFAAAGRLQRNGVTSFPALAVVVADQYSIRCFTDTVKAAVHQERFGPVKLVILVGDKADGQAAAFGQWGVFTAKNPLDSRNLIKPCGQIIGQIKAFFLQCDCDVWCVGFEGAHGMGHKINEYREG